MSGNFNITQAVSSSNVATYNLGATTASKPDELTALINKTMGLNLPQQQPELHGFNRIRKFWGLQTSAEKQQAKIEKYARRFITLMQESVAIKKNNTINENLLKLCEKLDAAFCGKIGRRNNERAAILSAALKIAVIYEVKQSKDNFNDLVTFKELIAERSQYKALKEIYQGLKIGFQANPKRLEALDSSYFLCLLLIDKYEYQTCELIRAREALSPLNVISFGFHFLIKFGTNEERRSLALRRLRSDPHFCSAYLKTYSKEKIPRREDYGFEFEYVEARKEFVRRHGKQSKEKERVPDHDNDAKLSIAEANEAQPELMRYLADSFSWGTFQSLSENDVEEKKLALKLIAERPFLFAAFRNCKLKISLQKALKTNPEVLPTLTEQVRRKIITLKDFCKTPEEGKDIALKMIALDARVYSVIKESGWSLPITS